MKQRPHPETPHSAPSHVPGPRTPPAPRTAPHVRIAVIGAGFGGIGAGVRLRRAGITDFTVLERAGDVGGTWRDNTYPGCACDVPSHMYSFSFAPNPRWPSSFSGQPEIHRYLRETADRYGVREHVRLHTEVRSARWETASGRWRLTTGNPDLPELTSEILVSAAGPLSDPVVPEIPGLDAFPGPVFHSARWDHSFDAAGRRVAVVGTGASAVQIVPALQPRARRLVLFQRTPAWVLPRRDRAITRAEQRLFAAFPPAQQAARLAVYLRRESMVPAFTRSPRLMRAAEVLARAVIRRHIDDPELRARLTPDYTLGCKRVLLSDDYYPALAQPNTEVVPAGLARVEGRRLIGSDGTAREADAVVFATGFRTTDLPVAERITGLDGRTLAETWSQGMHALRGTAIPGFPNLFTLIGPNTGLGHNSMIHIIESQLNFLMDAISRIDALGGAALHPRADAERAWNERVQQRLGRTVWTTGGCASWYLDGSGRNTTLWPGTTLAFRRATRRLAPAEFRPAPAPLPRLPAVRSADGTRLHVEVHGPEEAPTLVLVHGWTCSTPFWRPALHRLRRDYRVVAYDLRGHGRSGRPADRRVAADGHGGDGGDGGDCADGADGGGYGTRALADDLEAVLTATVPAGRRAVVAGHSMGAATLLAAAGRPAVRARTAAVLLASTGTDRLADETAVLPAALGPARPALSRAVLGSRAPLGPVTPAGKRVLKHAVLGPSATPAQVELCARVVHACPVDVRAAWGRVLAGLDLREAAAGLDAPARVLVGGADRLTPPPHAQRLAARLPHCESLTVLEGAGHMTPVERPEDFTAALRELAAEHLEEAAAPAGAPAPSPARR